MPTAIDRLANAIGYPERPPADATSFTFQVDGADLVATAQGGGLRLVCRLTDDDFRLPVLARLAAGRMLREDAVLAADADGAFLWLDVAPDADSIALRRAFETFADSCDWWRERTEAAAAPEPDHLPEMTIRP